MPKGAPYKPVDKGDLLRLLRNGTECRNIDFSRINNLSGLFQGHENILLQDNVYFIDPKNPDLLIWNTENVTEMAFMFYDCWHFNKPVRLDLSKTTGTVRMFGNCYSFNQEIDFDCSSLLTLKEMFLNCRSLNKPIKLRNLGKKKWDFINEKNFVKFFTRVFKGCDSLKEWNLVYLDFDENIRFEKKNFENVYNSLSGRDFKTFLNKIKKKYSKIANNEKIQYFLNI